MPTLELYLVRHGVAAERVASREESERPLTPEGIRRARAVARRLRDAEVHFDGLFTSPLVRARETAQLLHEAGVASAPVESALLAPGGDFDAWLRWLATWRRGGGVRLGLVGHEPELGEWAERLLWGQVRHQLVVKKAGLIGLVLPGSGSPVGRSLLFLLVPPKLLLG